MKETRIERNGERKKGERGEEERDDSEESKGSLTHLSHRSDRNLVQMMAQGSSLRGLVSSASSLLRGSPRPRGLVGAPARAADLPWEGEETDEDPCWEEEEAAWEAADMVVAGVVGLLLELLLAEVEAALGDAEEVAAVVPPVAEEEVGALGGGEEGGRSMSSSSSESPS